MQEDPDLQGPRGADDPGRVNAGRFWVLHDLDYKKLDLGVTEEDDPARLAGGRFWLSHHLTYKKLDFGGIEDSDTLDAAGTSRSASEIVREAARRALRNQAAHVSRMADAAAKKAIEAQEVRHHPSPPMIGEQVLRLVFGPDQVEGVLGCLFEDFAAQVERGEPKRALGRFFLSVGLRFFDGMIDNLLSWFERAFSKLRT